MNNLQATFDFNLFNEADMVWATPPDSDHALQSMILLTQR